MFVKNVTFFLKMSSYQLGENEVLDKTTNRATIVILESGFSDPQLRQNFKPIAKLICTVLLNVKFMPNPPPPDDSQLH